MTARKAAEYFAIGDHVFTPAETACLAAMATAPRGGVSIYQVAEITGLTIRTVARFMSDRAGLVVGSKYTGRLRYWELSKAGTKLSNSLRRRLELAAE